MPEPVVVLGVAPGIKRLAYVVLLARGEHPRMLDHDVVRGARTQAATPESELRRKAGIPLKILEVVIERAPPVVIAVGPPGFESEPTLHIQMCRVALRLLVAAMNEQGFRIQYREWPTREELAAELGSRSLRGATKKIDGIALIRGKPLELAAASALAGLSTLSSR